MPDLSGVSSLAWAVGNKFQTENQRELEFRNHRYLIDMIDDMHPDQAWIKSAQVGGSVAMIVKTGWCCKYMDSNVAYVLPTQNVVKDFVDPKVNPIIVGNPAFRSIVTKDSISLKQIGDRYIYYRGSSSEREAISISVDILVLDELDRMMDMGVVNIYDSRLQASPNPKRWRLSNPSQIGFGIDALYKDSDQMHWFMTCSNCRHEWYIDFDRGERNHYLDQEKEVYRCGNSDCDKELSDTDRRNGRWVAAYPKRTHRRGYWVSQLMVPNISAKRIMEQFRESSVEFFYNFVLGKAYTSADMLIERKTFIDNMKPGQPQYRNVVMGSDIGKPHWYWLGTPDGVFKVGKAESWDELEKLFLLYKCEAWVIDAQPEFTKVQEMLRKYHGKAYACYFVRDSKEIGIVRWLEGAKYGTVHADRTKIIDRLVTEIATGEIKFYVPIKDLEPLIQHATNMYRTVETDEQGKIKVNWNTPEGKPDHLMFAGVYWRMALEQAFSGIGHGVVETQDPIVGKEAPTVINGKIEVAFDIDEALERAELRSE